MKVVADFSRNYPEEQSRYFNFHEYEDIAKDCILYVGGWPHDSIYNEEDVPKFFLSTEEQVWDRDSTDIYLPYVEKILTICPPRLTNRQKRQGVFIPINEKLIPEPTEKIFDVIYTGLAEMQHVSDIIDTIRHFNYCLVSFSELGGLTTHQNVTFPEKLQLISKSKCCVVHNLLPNGTPQLKSRPFEASFSKSLMLVLRDNFNLIEEWFTPGEDFLYYSNKEELFNLIKECSANYNNYAHIVQNAYDKAINNYTSRKFIQTYIGFK